MVDEAQRTEDWEKEKEKVLMMDMPPLPSNPPPLLPPNDDEYYTEVQNPISGKEYYTEVPNPKSGEEYYYKDGSKYIKGIFKSTKVREGMQYYNTVNTINDKIVDKVYSIRHVRSQQNNATKQNIGELHDMKSPTPTPTPPTPPLKRRKSFGGGKRKSRHNRKINKTKKSYKKSTKSKKNKKSTRKRKTNKKRKSRRTYRRK